MMMDRNVMRDLDLRSNGVVNATRMMVVMESGSSGGQSQCMVRWWRGCF